MHPYVLLGDEDINGKLADKGHATYIAEKSLYQPLRAPARLGKACRSWPSRDQSSHVNGQKSLTVAGSPLVLWLDNLARQFKPQSSQNSGWFGRLGWARLSKVSEWKKADQRQCFRYFCGLSGSASALWRRYHPNVVSGGSWSRVVRRALVPYLGDLGWHLHFRALIANPITIMIMVMPKQVTNITKNSANS